MAWTRRCSGDDGKWLHSGYILEEDPVGFAAAFDRDKSSERKRGIKMDSNIIGLAYWED